MIASVVISNLVYLIGAVVLAVIGGVAYTLRHRKPKSVEANMASFNKGLRALAPEAEPARVARPPSRVPAGPQIRTIHTVLPGHAAPAGDDRPDTGSAPAAGADAEPDTALGGPARHDGPMTTEAETG